jgi:hypothetical protein
MKKLKRTSAVLRAGRKKVAAVIVLARAIYEGMVANPALFPAPNPAMAVFLALIVKLEASQLKALSKIPGAAVIRDADCDNVYNAMELLRTYVQSLCDASPEQAMVILKAAAMDARKVGTFHKPVLEVKPGPVPGTVILVANATALIGKGVYKKALFNWQSSVDGGKTWVTLSPTPLATTQVSGLASATTVAFRVCVTVAKVTHDWSQAVTFLVR